MGAPAHFAVDAVPLAMPRIYDELWAEHGPALVAANNDRVEAIAALAEAAGQGWPG